ncbi:uncharacterized protein K444DRAFT_618429 [Hyaloscypha bicolor E]|uniref:Uncharacterized protein n=1 Tax=Hyaloscypha bicolor E TaxID=1095630 RepID=A0A2J6ST63_9HELO|nr:uncharacterized protein K444DRAFT_618429 [Hyaloscypha bicolor E]PMD53968.1 hypothetical protein K444DRAFT_618429 [Hyaloscypha bicolor E]
MTFREFSWKPKFQSLSPSSEMPQFLLHRDWNKHESASSLNFISPPPVLQISGESPLYPGLSRSCESSQRPERHDNFSPCRAHFPSSPPRWKSPSPLSPFLFPLCPPERLAEKFTHHLTHSPPGSSSPPG